MTTIRQIAEDPNKALKALEKELGAEPGEFVRAMDRLGDGEGWKDHVPYLVAESYYDDETLRARYQEHVDSCDYCKQLLQTLHPTDLQVQGFAQQATLEAKQKQNARPGYWPWYSVPLAALAAIIVTAIGLPSLGRYGILPPFEPQKQFVVKELRQQPDKLADLQKSNSPTERYRAAQYLFAVEQPQLAYRQIGEGLELAGVSPKDAATISAAADIPANASAGPVLANAAQQVETLKSNATEREPIRLLDLAVGQAKLGLHQQSLKSIQRYLQARNFDQRVVTEYSETALAKRMEPLSSVK